MSIRACASENVAFSRLKEVFDNPDMVARQKKAEGKFVVGTMGNDVPDEVILASGAFPVRVNALAAEGTENANQFLELNFDEITRRTFEKLINGYYAQFCDRIVISSSTDVNIRVYNYIREIHRTEPDFDVPSEYFVDILFTDYPQHVKRNNYVVEKFTSRMGLWTGKAITDEELKRASEICNENRKAIREFCKLRWSANPRVLGSEALVVIASSLFMDKEEHTALVKKITKDAALWPETGLKKIYYTGSVQDNINLYSLIEKLGGNVVVEDHDWGYRCADTDVDLSGNIIEAIADRYMHRMPNPKKAPVDDCVSASEKLIEMSGAEAMLLYSLIEDETFAWNYPSQRKALSEKAVSCFALGQQVYPFDISGESEEKLSGFISGIKEA